MIFQFSLKCLNEVLRSATYTTKKTKEDKILRQLRRPFLRLAVFFHSFTRGVDVKKRTVTII